MPKPSRARFTRHRQAPKTEFDKASYRTKKIGHGLRLVIGCYKGHWNKRTHRCNIGTRVQSILVPKNK